MAERKSRLRSLFQNFYGIGLPENEAKIQQNKMNIDGPSYDPHDDFLRMVKTASLVSVQKRYQEVQKGLSVFYYNARYFFVIFFF